MRERIALALALTGLFALSAGCRKKVDTSAFKAAINESFAGRHECIWPEPVKLPVQADPSTDERVRDYDALTHAGLFIRESVEKKHSLGVSKMEYKYDLSDKGHPSWTPDASRPAYGNFCFGHFNVTAIDKAIPNDPSNPTQYTVIYRYEVEGIPEWARTPESMRAFRKVAADTSIQSASATLVKATDGAWTVAPHQPVQ
jgi:hypothetical protein